MDVLSFSSSLSHSLFLTVKTKTSSPLHRAPHTPRLPTCGRAGLHLDSCRWGVWTVELQCIMFKLSKKNDDIVILGQQFTRCGVSSQPITWHLHVTILWFILLWPINTQHGGRGELCCGWNADLLDINSEALAQPAQLCSVEELGEKQEVQNGTCDIFVHLRNFCLRFWFCLYRECFAMEKKNYTYGNSLKNWGRPTKNVFFFPYFSAYCNCPCLSIQRGRYACLSFWNVKEKLLLFDKKRTYDSDPRCLKALCWHCMLLGWVASPVYCVVMLACWTWSNPVSSPVH